ncbi:MAG: hypothetical protein J6W64_01960 [Bacilli bacterium]|nr:hypothetical protein [Bacilli bacterium]
MLEPLNLRGVRIGKTIPLAFDDSLSYLEELSAILYKLNEVIAQVNAYPDLLEEYEQYLIDIRQEVGRLEVEYEQFKTSTTNSINTQFSELSSQVYSTIDNQFRIIDYNLGLELADIQTQIDNIIAGDIKVHDPTTGLLSPIQIVIDNIYDMNRSNAITCTEFDGIEFTATAFDAVEITAFNFDTNGKDLLNVNL